MLQHDERPPDFPDLVVMNANPPRRLIVGMSGASGMPFGVRLLQILREVPDLETHLVMTPTAKLNLALETAHTAADVEALADVVHSPKDVAASISSGSFRTHGMIVAPCSIRTLSGIVNSYSDNLLTRAADVVLKERRRLVLMLRETPLHTGHCRLMYEASQMGVILFPPVPAFYTNPRSVDDIVTNSVGRALDLFDIDAGVVTRWTGARGRGEGD